MPTADFDPLPTALACPAVALVRTVGKVGNNGTINGDVGANDSGGSFRLGKNVLMADGNMIAGDTLKLGAGTSVFDVFANQFQGIDATIRGGTGTPILPLTDPFCQIPDFTCGGPDVIVQSGQTTGPLAPGTYGRLVVFSGGTLVLDQGEFTFCSVKISRNATVQTTGTTASIVDVRDYVRVADASFFGPAAGTPIPVVNVSGRTVRVGSGGTLEAYVSAPNAQMSTGRS
jgi:hypothetical protein